MWNLKYDTNEPISEMETENRHREVLGYQGEVGWSRKGVGGWD